MGREIRLEEVEADLLADRSAIPGAVDAWLDSPARSRARSLRILARGETVRSEFEAALANEPGAQDLWATFCPTEQREILGTVNYYRFWPRRWEISRTIRAGVLPGPTYPSTEPAD